MTSPGPKVSVLVITYNHERFVERAVRSVLSQKADFEIIVGEDCSTDGTRTVLNRLDADFQGQLRLLYRERNLGPARNFHGAYAECRGDYVAYLDGDDYWIDPAKLRKQVALLDADPGCALCYHPTRYVGADGEPIGYVHPRETTPNQPTIDDLFRSNLITTSSAVVRRAAVRELPDWMLRVVPGDWPLFLLAADAGSVRRLDEVMAAYRVHPGGTWTQLSAAARIERTFAMFTAVDRHFRGKYADQVETGRIAFMNEMCYQTNYVHQETAAELAAVRQELALSRQKLAMTQSELAVVHRELATTAGELAKVNRARSVRLARAVIGLSRRAIGWPLRPTQP